MVHVNINNKEFDIDGILKKNLDKVKEVIRKDWDYLYVIDGEVGSGKSVLAQTLAWYASDGTLTIENIAFSPEQFKKAVVNAKPYHAVVFDEAFRGLSARSALTKANKVIVSMLQEIRQKNLFVFIVLPSVWDLDGYVSKHRMKGLFHVYVDKDRKRGYYRFFTNETMRVWLSDSKKKYKYPRYASFFGKFCQGYKFNGKRFKRYIVGEKVYLKKKNEALGSFDDEVKIKADVEAKRFLLQLGLAHKILHDQFRVTYKKQGEWFSISHHGINHRINEYNKGLISGRGLEDERRVRLKGEVKTGNQCLAESNKQKEASEVSEVSEASETYLQEATQ